MARLLALARHNPLPIAERHDGSGRVQFFQSCYPRIALLTSRVSASGAAADSFGVGPIMEGQYVNPTSSDLPYHHSFAILGPRPQGAILSMLLRGLGYEPRQPLPIVGLSGMAHEVPMVGVQPESKIILVAQTGAEEMYPSSVGERLPPGTLPRPDDLPSDPTERARLWLQRSLFVTYDVKDALEAKGWKCESLYFFNSLTTPTATMSDKERRQWLADNIPGGTRLHEQHSGEPVRKVSIDTLRNHVISVGAAFVSAEDLTLAEIRSFSSADYQAVQKQVTDALQRVRLTQYFHPPTDELFMGAIDRQGRLALEKLVEIYETAGSLRHTPSGNVVVREARHDDPLLTLEALKKHRHVGYERDEYFVTDEGKAVAQRFYKTPQEALLVRILRELHIPDIFKALFDRFLTP